MNAETAHRLKKSIFFIFISCFALWIGLLLGHYAPLWIRAGFGYQGVSTATEPLYKLSEHVKTASLIMGFIYAVADILISSFTKDKNNAK